VRAVAKRLVLGEAAGADVHRQFGALGDFVGSVALVFDQSGHRDFLSVLSSAAVLMRAVISLTKDQPELLVKPPRERDGRSEQVRFQFIAINSQPSIQGD
jgi:hypothetical protein